MEYADIIIWAISFFVAVIVIILFLTKGKKIKIKDVSIGPITATFGEEPKKVVKEKVVKENVDKIEFLSVPLAGCAGEILSPPLKILLKDSTGMPITKKKIRLEFYNENGLLSSNNYYGKISAESDKNGVIVFDDLIIKKTGQVQIHIPIDNIDEVTEDIEIFPPGLNIDFWNEKVGTERYEEKLDRALRFTKTN